MAVEDTGFKFVCRSYGKLRPSKGVIGCCTMFASERFGAPQGLNGDNLGAMCDAGMGSNLVRLRYLVRDTALNLGYFWSLLNKRGFW